MINSKRDYEFYLKADSFSLGRSNKFGFTEKAKSILFPDYIWQFLRLLRKMEYFHNCKSNINTIRYAVAWRNFTNLSLKLGFSIPINTWGPGLDIAHYGLIVINGCARLGENCKLFPGIVIGSKIPTKAPRIGNNVYIGAGSKIIGEIEIADDIAIGANSVVNKSFTEPGITIAGCPAQKISNNGSIGLITRGTVIAKNNS